MENDTFKSASPDGCPPSAHISQAGEELRSGALPAESEGLGDLLVFCVEARNRHRRAGIMKIAMEYDQLVQALGRIIASREAKPSPAGNAGGMARELAAQDSDNSNDING